MLLGAAGESRRANRDSLIAAVCVAGMRSPDLLRVEPGWQQE
jgi:hypothetical protein